MTLLTGPLNLAPTQGLRLPLNGVFSNVVDTGRHRRMQDFARLREPDASMSTGEEKGVHRRFELTQRPTDIPCSQLEMSRRCANGPASHRGFQNRQLMRPTAQRAECPHR